MVRSNENCGTSAPAVAPAAPPAKDASTKVKVAWWANSLLQTLFQACVLKKDVVQNVRLEASSRQLGTGDVIPGLARAAGLAWSSDGKQIWRESDAAKESLFTQARSVLVSSGLNSGLVTCDL